MRTSCVVFFDEVLKMQGRIQMATGEGVKLDTVDVLDVFLDVNCFPPQAKGNGGVRIRVRVPSHPDEDQLCFDAFKVRPHVHVRQLHGEIEVGLVDQEGEVPQEVSLAATLECFDHPAAFRWLLGRTAAGAHAVSLITSDHIRQISRQVREHMAA